MRYSVLAIIRESDEPIVCVPLYDENVLTDIAHSVSPFLIEITKLPAALERRRRDHSAGQYARLVSGFLGELLINCQNSFRMRLA